MHKDSTIYIEINDSFRGLSVTRHIECNKCKNKSDCNEFKQCPIVNKITKLSDRVVSESFQPNSLYVTVIERQKRWYERIRHSTDYMIKKQMQR